jgi:hypothetical protein
MPLAVIGSDAAIPQQGAACYPSSEVLAWSPRVASEALSLLSGHVASVTFKPRYERTLVIQMLATESDVLFSLL